MNQFRGLVLKWARMSCNLKVGTMSSFTCKPSSIDRYEFIVLFRRCFSCNLEVGYMSVIHGLWRRKKWIHYIIHSESEWAFPFIFSLAPHSSCFVTRTTYWPVLSWSVQVYSAFLFNNDFLLRPTSPSPNRYSRGDRILCHDVSVFHPNEPPWSWSCSSEYLPFTRVTWHGTPRYRWGANSIVVTLDSINSKKSLSRSRPLERSSSVPVPLFTRSAYSSYLICYLFSLFRSSSRVRRSPDSLSLPGLLQSSSSLTDIELYVQSSPIPMLTRPLRRLPAAIWSSRKHLPFHLTRCVKCVLSVLMHPRLRLPVRHYCIGVFIRVFDS